MSDIINYLINNHEQILGAMTSVVAACSAAALTPTPMDDGWVRKLYKIVDFLALNIGRAKEK